MSVALFAGVLVAACLGSIAGMWIVGWYVSGWDRNDDE